MNYDIVIVGAGIIGLSTSLNIVEQNPSLKVLIIEKEAAVAQHQSGHNSGVIHSGIYYRPGSLKAKNCIEGYNLLVEFCKTWDIPYEICGKVIVATSQEELGMLDTLYKRGVENGLKGIEKISRDQIKEREPNAEGLMGLLVPQTGIVDFKSIAGKYAEISTEHGVDLRFNHLVEDLIQKPNGVEVVTSEGTFATKCLINCAGLHSDRIALKINPKLPLRIIPFRGEYYLVKDEKRNLVKSLIYPVPNPEFPFLGVHFTRMVNGNVEAGPNAVLAFKREGYQKKDISIFDTYDAFSWRGFQRVALKYWKEGLGEFYRSYRKKAFVSALQQLVPNIQERDLVPGGSGIRAQACNREGKLLDDFYFYETNNMVHVLNAPSPAATSSLAIGKAISERVLAKIASN